MNQSFIVLAFMAALPLSGQVGFTALYTQFEYPPAPEVVNALQSEVSTLLTADGLRFQWKSLPLRDNEVWSDLAVLSFKGRCKVLPPAVRPARPDRLGWTHVTDGEVIPFADIDCDAIRTYIDRDLPSVPQKSQETVLGRAVGRVVAHELLHVFSRARSHSSAGVDRPSLTVAELMAEKLSLVDHERKLTMLRAGKTTPPVFLGSAQAGRQQFIRDGCSSCHGIQAEGSRRGPVLRASGRVLTTIMLAAKLTKHQKKMLKDAHALKLDAPSIAEADLADLVSFLNQFDQR